MAFKSSLTSTTIDKFGSLVHKGFNKLTGTVQESENKITASDGSAYDNFSYTGLAVGSGRIIVGADRDDDDGSNSGSAYIFDLDGTQLAKITASDGAAGDQFGISVAVGSSRIVVGAAFDDDAGTSSGSAYIFDLDGTQLAKITASDAAAYDSFGFSVAVGNGRIVVGAFGDDDNGSNSGSAYIFDLDGTQLAKITASDGSALAYFGWSVAVGSGRIVVGASREWGIGPFSYSGSAYIFDLDGNQLAKITASDAAYNNYFGWTVAVGNGKIVVGATLNGGSAYIFDLDGTFINKITASDGPGGPGAFGQSAAVGNGRIVVGGCDPSIPGAAYIYQIEENFDVYIENIVKS